MAMATATFLFVAWARAAGTCGGLHVVVHVVQHTASSSSHVHGHSVLVHLLHGDPTILGVATYVSAHWHLTIARSENCQQRTNARQPRASRPRAPARAAPLIRYRELEAYYK